jgi:hypothetical protein
MEYWKWRLEFGERNPFYHTSAEIEAKIFFLLCVLSASALKVVADPSFGGSAVGTPMHPTANIHPLISRSPE